MVASDETHLTDFGNAKAWPIYLMLGNLSKYIRSQPNSGAMHHLAYIPSVRMDFFFNKRCQIEQFISFLLHSRISSLYSTANGQRSTGRL